MLGFPLVVVIAIIIFVIFIAAFLVLLLSGTATASAFPFRTATGGPRPLVTAPLGRTFTLTEPFLFLALIFTPALVLVRLILIPLVVIIVYLFQINLGLNDTFFVGRIRKDRPQLGGHPRGKEIVTRLAQQYVLIGIARRKVR